MTFDEFLAVDPDRTHDLSAALGALAHDRAGHVAAAHERVQSDASSASNRVHAYLHRKEGDEANACYWYDRVGEAPFHGTLDDEWHALARRFLG